MIFGISGRIGLLKLLIEFDLREKVTPKCFTVLTLD